MKRPLFWASLSVVAGILAELFFLSPEDSSKVYKAVITTGVGSAAVIAIVFIIVNAVAPACNKTLRRIPMYIAIMFLAFLAGVSYGRFFVVREGKFRARVSEEKQVTGIVREVRSGWFAAEVNGIVEGGFLSSFRVVAFCEEAPPECGDYVCLFGPFSEIEGPRNEGEWDAATYYRGLGIVLRANHYEKLSKRAEGLFYTTARLRSRMLRTVELLYPEETRGIAAGILCGDRDDIDEEVYKRYRDLGIAHILAVSGMHVAALGGAVLWLFGRMFRKSYARLFASGFLLLYGVFTGFPVSCVRAVLFFLFVTFGSLFHRTVDRRTAVAFLMLLLLLRRPCVCFQTGFLLSFACAFAIILITEVLPSWKTENRILRGAVFALSLQFLLLPIQITLFYRVSTVGFLLNAIVVPLLFAVFLSLFFGALAAQIWMQIGRFVSGTAHFGLAAINRLTAVVAEIPGTVAILGRATWVRFLWYGILAVCVFFLLRKKRKIAFLLMAAGFVCFLPIHSADCRIVNLSVGQGDCCVILKGSRCFVIDCGSTTKKDVGEKILEPFLAYHGYSKPDAIFVTHTDADHVNGLSELLLDEWKDTPVFVTEYEEDSDFLQEMLASGCGNLRVVSYNDTFSVSCGMFCGELRFTVLWPIPGLASEDRNHCNLLLYMEDRHGEAVFTADADTSVLSQVLEIHSARIRRSDYLKVAHHGSVYSKADAFYEEVKSAVAVVSVGKNSYGHPHPTVLSALASAGAKVFVTAECGQVTTILAKRGIKVQTFLKTEAE